MDFTSCPGYQDQFCQVIPHDPFWVQALEAALSLADRGYIVYTPSCFCSFSEHLLPLEYSEIGNLGNSAFVCPKDDAQKLSRDFRKAYPNTLSPCFANEVFVAAANPYCELDSSHFFENHLPYFHEVLALLATSTPIQTPNINQRSAPFSDKMVLLLNANGMGNVGDDLMAQLARRWLHELLPDCHIVVAEADVTRSLVAASSAVVLGGGGFIYDAHSELCDLQNIANWMKLPFWAADAKVPVAAISLGSQGLYSRKEQQFVAKALSIPKTLTVRDTYTSHLLHHISKGAIKAPSYPDMLFALPLRYQRASSPPQRLLISGQWERYGVHFLESLSNALASSSLDIVFAVMAMEDNYTAEFLQGRLSGRKKGLYSIVSMSRNERSAEQIALEYGSADAILTTRFHGAVLSLACERPLVILDHPGGKKHRLIEDYFPELRGCLLLGYRNTPADLNQAVNRLLQGSIQSVNPAKLGDIKVQAESHKVSLYPLASALGIQRSE